MGFFIFIDRPCGLVFKRVAGGVNASETNVAYVEPLKERIDMSNEYLMALEPNQGHLLALEEEKEK